MRTLSLAGPGGILCLSGVVVVAAFCPEPSVEIADHSASIEVRRKDRDCLIDPSASPVLTDVRSTLASVDLDSRSLIADVGAALEAIFGEQVTMTDEPMEYVWIQINGLWFRYCVSQGIYEIDFGPKGTVVVEARVNELMPPARIAAHTPTLVARN